MEVAGANRRWRLPFRCRGSRRESAVAQLFSLGRFAMTDAQPIDPIEFEYMLAYFSERIDIPALRKSNLDKKAFFALILEPMKERYTEPKKRGFFMLRWLALQGLVWSGKLPEEFCNPSTNWIHPSAVHLAARFPVLPKIRFDPELFLQALREESL